MNLKILSYFFFVGVVLLFSITAIINFVNFMDGIDGLVAGCMLIIIASISWMLHIPWPYWSLAGALLGFLLLNWSPAKVFMGDVGSTFLGAVFAGLVLQARSWHEAFSFLLVLSPLLADAFICIVRRLFAGHNIFKARRLHLFQRIHQAGWSHRQVSILYASATAMLAFALIFGNFLSLVFCVIAELSFGYVLSRRVAVDFDIASISVE